MQITERRIGQSIILDLTGELSYANRTTFKAAVERSKQGGCRHLILNMQGVRFLDSSALGTLALLAQSFPATQGMVSLLNPQSYVKEIITLANLHQILPVYTSEQDALAGEPSSRGRITPLSGAADVAEPAHRIVDEPLAGKAAKPTPVILLVDDDEMTRISMAGRLKRLGYRVIEADDGVAGLAAIRAQRPDLVILDWMMPGLDGPSVCEAIRADGELRSSQVVLMTAHDQPEQIAEGLSRGADDFLSKAASKQEVLARVQASLRSNALVREIERTRDDLDRSHRLLSAKQAELESELQSAADFVRAQLPLPGMPAPGVSMQWAYQPSLALGGDLFQVSAWGSETLGLYILDASGHGVAAALRAVALMSFLREDNLAKAVGSFDPGAIITEANHRFPLTQDGEYFTLWVGRLHLPSRTLSYAAAGHSGAFLNSLQGDSQWLSSASLPLGFDPAISFDSTTAQLQPRDRLYLLSDGIYEAPSPTGELWGRDRLQATLESHRAHTLAHSIGDTMTTARQWLGGDIFPDDVALLGVEVLDGAAKEKS